ncbi:hypothetical protein CWI84_07900 [Idiomarina tyrosinivorans]|uniref:HemY N-terminal domain-containing protein n=1 Tax=Idiomarina tyrosinivorans TaxID=1445662 RepID=A0A432ZPL6_9GAMM|nr:heme biosynthesis HemY N-terminal domain-containing protein [Idiomarina tyrosinivorans]RUO79875.1 hypothetical protein CWI84_07900 [Idiomarina tyrosinivorans]
MRRLLILLALLLVGVMVGPYIIDNSGYILVQFLGYSVEMTVVSFVLSLLIVAIIILLVAGLIKAVVHRAAIGRRWMRKRKVQRAKSLALEAIQALIEKQPRVALEKLKKALALEHTDERRLLQCLVADQLDDPELMRRLYQELGDIIKPSPLQQQKLAIREAAKQSPQQAARLLQQTLEKHPDDIELLSLALQLFAQQPAQLRPYVDQLLAAELIDSAMRERIFCAWFIELGQQGGDTLKIRWQSLKKAQRNDAVIRLAYIRALQHLGEQGIAAKVLLKGLKKAVFNFEQPSERQLFRYPDTELISYVQSHLKATPEDHFALAALARLALAANDAELAQKAMNKALQVYPTAERYRLLGDIHLALHESQAAAKAYQQAFNVKNPS